MATLIGQSIKGYEFRERVGAGAAGAVYRCFQPSLGREVAVKVILPQYANQPEFVRRFEVEAQLVARLEHPHIVPLYDYWRDPAGAYLVMRWLRGSLRASLARTPWKLEAAARLLDQVAAGLGAAHREGVVHRDLKPENILLDEDTNAYLADFGIAKDVFLRAERQTKGAALLLESAEYLSPEEILGEPVTPRSDLYSLGYVLYEMLTGEKPFPDATTPDEYVEKHLKSALPMISIQHSQIPAAVDEVLQTATAKDPTHRYPSAQRLAAAFRAALPVSLPRIPNQPLPDALTERELEVVDLMTQNFSYAEIAERLYVTTATVKWYFKQIYSKLDVHSRHQAIERVERMGLLKRGTQYPAAVTLPAEPGRLAEPDTLTADPENPYKGLRAFQEADAADYFGRAGMTERLLSRLSEKGDYARILVVVGPSGSGKSSLVRAGLIPALRSGALANSPAPFIADLYPGTHPLEELEAALLHVAVNPLPGLLDQLREDRRGLVRAARQVLPKDPDTELILVVDQFEEIFTLVTDESVRLQFIDNLLSAVTDPRGRIRIILTLRADFYDRPLLYPRLAELVRASTEVIVPLTAREMEQAITAPAEHAGLRLEAGLVSTILKDVGEQPGTLPLLQYALTELFERREGVMLTLAAYQSMNGVKGALTRRADEIYTSLDEQSQALARQMILRMVTLGYGTEDTRRRVLLAELLALGDEAAVDDVIQSFAEYRLLTLDHDPVTRGPTVELAHEALLRSWEPLRAFLNESREDIRLQRQLSAAAQEWASAGQEESFLLRGARLERLGTWADGTNLTLTPEERDYLGASRAADAAALASEAERRSRETRLQRRSQRFLQALVAVLLVAVIGALILTALAVTNARAAESERDRAEDLARLSQSRELVGYASDQSLLDPELSALLALQAVNLTHDTEGTVLPEANTALHQAMQGLRSPLQIPAADAPMDRSLDWAYVPSFTPDGGRIVYPQVINTDLTGGDVAAVADAATGRVLYTLDGVSSAVTPNNRVLTSVYAPGDGFELRLWDVTPAGQPELLRTIPLDAYDPIWWTTSPNLRFYMQNSEEGGNQIWDLASGDEVAPDRVQAALDGKIVMGFTPDESLLAVRNLDGTATMLDTSTWLPAFTLSSPDAQILITALVFKAAGFSSDNRFMAVPVVPDGVELWDLTSGEARLFETPFAPDYVALNADGSRLAASTEAGELITWDTATQTEIARFGVTGLVSLSLNADGTRLATLRSGLLQIWEVTAGEEALTLLAASADIDSSPKSLAYNPDGSRLVTSAVTETPIVWDVSTGEQLLTLEGHTGRSRTVAWSPDGATIAGGSDDGTVILWNAETGEALHTLDANFAFGNGVAFSPDSRRIAATGGNDSTLRIWDVATGELLSDIATDLTPFFVAWSPDGAHIAVGTLFDGETGGDVLVYDANSGEQVMNLATPNTNSVRVAFSPDGTRLLASTFQAHIAQIWDVRTGEPLLMLSGHTQPVVSVAYSPDGTLIATSSWDGTTRLWDAETGEQVLVLPGSPSGVGDVVFSPDGRELATIQFDGTARIYVVPVDDAIALTESRLTRWWTPEECQRFLHTDSCPPMPEGVDLPAQAEAGSS